MRDCPYSTTRRSHSSPRLRWADSGPAEHPERIDVEYLKQTDPTTLTRGILKPIRTEPFEWKRRSRLRAGSFSDEPIDWDLIDYAEKLFITSKDSQAARQKKIEEKEKKRRKLFSLSASYLDDARRNFIPTYIPQQTNNSLSSINYPPYSNLLTYTRRPPYSDVSTTSNVNSETESKSLEKLVAERAVKLEAKINSRIKKY